MTGLSAERATQTFPNTLIAFVGGDPAGLPVAASTKIWAGSIVCVNTGGYVTKGAATASLVAIGVANVTADNTSGSNGSISLPVRSGCWWFANSSSGDEITNADLGNYCYIVDDQTVAKTDSSGTRPAAGIIRGVDATLGVAVEFEAAGVARPLLPSNIPAQSGGNTRTVRGVGTSNVADLANFTVAGVDGLTYAAGDRILLVGQSTASENGVYVVGTVALGVAPLTRPNDWATGIVLSGMLVGASEGTLYKDSLWMLTEDGAITVDTTDETFEKIDQAPGAASVGNTLGVASTGKASWAALNVGGGAGYVSGVLPATNGGTAGDSAESIGVRVVRGVVYSNVADLANFTVAATDLTFVQGDRVLLINQTTGSQNGIYVVGVVGGGTAPLTLATDWATGNVFGGLVINVRAGTIFGGMSIRVTNTTAITVGSTTPTFAPVQQKLTVTLSGGTVTVNAGVWLTSASKITATRATISGTPGALIVVDSTARTAGLPGTGAFTLTAGTVADPTVPAGGDNGTVDVVING